MTGQEDRAGGVGITSEEEAPLGLRQRKQARTRAELKAAADRLFDRYGFDQVTVEDICDEVDISPRTFFRYFHSKDEIVFESVQPRYDQVTRELALRPPEEPAFEALASVLADVLGNPDYEQDAARVHTRMNNSPELMRASLGSYRRFQDDLVELIAPRSPCDGDRGRARLLVGVALVALQTAVEEWAEHPDQPLRTVLAAMLRQVAGVETTIDVPSRSRVRGR